MFKTMINKFPRNMLVASCGLVLAACDPISPEEKAGKIGDVDLLGHDFTVNQSSMSNLSADDQYVVANKVLATMYRGVPADEFFDMSAGFTNPVVAQDNFIVDLQTKLQTPLTYDELLLLNAQIFGRDDDPNTTDVDETIEARFTSIDSDHPHQIYMARMQTYPISKDQFTLWMSYFLANTIMFSPAREMDSTDNLDITRVLGYLEGQIENQASVRDIVRGWLHNLSRWRVSRSPENHALEMYELYLGKFNDSEEDQLNTLNGGIACGEWYLTDDQEGYQLAKDLTKVAGNEAVKVFGQYVSSCEDLYDVVAGHPLLMARVIEVIANYFLDGESEEVRLGLVEKIANSGVETFDQIFMAIMFSEEFLLSNARPKTFEENAFNFLGTMNWNPRYNNWSNLGRRTLDYMLDSSDNNSSLGVHNMGWAAMDYKIGRTPFIPMDALSFASYHKGMRESVLMQQRGYDGRDFPELEDFDVYQQDEDGNFVTDENGDWILVSEATEAPYPLYDGAFYKRGTEDLKESLENLTAAEFIDYVFMSAMSRRATEAEQTAFQAEGILQDWVREDDDNILQLRRTPNGDELWENRTDDFAEVMLDYMSRLPEFYYFRAVN